MQSIVNPLTEAMAAKVTATIIYNGGSKHGSKRPESPRVSWRPVGVSQTRMVAP